MNRIMRNMPRDEAPRSALASGKGWKLKTEDGKYEKRKTGKRKREAQPVLVQGDQAGSN
jgi:hypothetical protein